MRYLIAQFLILYCFLLSDIDSLGVLKGKLFSGKNQLPLAGANIFIKGTNLGTTSDENGEFIINNIFQGYYSVSASYIGYKKEIIADIWIRPKAYDYLNIILEPTLINLEGVSVQESYFKKSILNEYQSTSFKNDEIRRAPGSGQEISRILNSLPSVASVGENRQDMMVRGGGPTENGFIIDNIPIPSISHFNQPDGRSNGPVGLINTEMVENIEFYSNGFSAKFGNKLSSFGDIKYRDGNQENLEATLGLGMGGLGGFLEGPFSQNISYIASYRRSYLNLLADAINAGGMPSYDDFQGKITYRPNMYNTYTLLTINGRSTYDRSLEDAIDVGEGSYGIVGNKQNTIGINHKRIWNENSFSNSSIALSKEKANISFNNTFSKDPVFNSYNLQNTLSIRQLNQIKQNSNNIFEFGFEYYLRKTKYDFLLNDIENKKNISVSNMSTFSTLKQVLFDRVVLSSGLRLDYNSYEKRILFSPRINIDYAMKNGKSNIIYNIGQYYQNPPEIYISIDENILKSVSCWQHSLSLERMLSISTKITVSVYHKEYKNAPMFSNVSNNQPESFLLDQLTMHSGIMSNGQAESYGIEILIEKKRAENFYGLIGGSLFNSTFFDSNGKKRNRNHNYKSIFNIVGGYRPSDSNWEISVRWSYFGGKPYTGINEELSLRYGQETSNNNRFNEDKTPEYHSLFLRYERRKNMKIGNLVSYFELWNAYNRKNIELYFWSEADEKINEITYFSLIPVGGFELEF